MKGTYTTEQLLHTLKDIKFTDIEEHGFMPVYERQEITDDLHETCGFRTDYQSAIIFLVPHKKSKSLRAIQPVQQARQMQYQNEEHKLRQLTTLLQDLPYLQ